jgi:hypothetical protein
MKREVKLNIKNLARKSQNAEHGNEAMHFAQAALNLAHTLATLAATKKETLK